MTPISFIGDWLLQRHVAFLEKKYLLDNYRFT